MTLFRDLTLTEGRREDKFLRMWDFNGKCVAEMEGHDDGIVSISARGYYLASSDYSGGLQRKISCALAGHRSGFLKLRNSSPEPDDWCQGVRLEQDFWACSPVGASQNRIAFKCHTLAEELYLNKPKLIRFYRWKLTYW